MNVIALVSVGIDNEGVPYNKQSLNQISKLINELGFEVRVLTDTPDIFARIGCITYQYDKKIFNYFDKLFFSITLAKHLNEGIVYVDIDNLAYLTESDEFLNLQSTDSVLFVEHWPTYAKGYLESWKYLTDLKIGKWTDPLVEYLKIEGKDPSQLDTMFERLLYFPAGLDWDAVQYQLEKIKPVFDYMSLFARDLSNRTIYGHGEGLALSYALSECGIKKELIKDQNNNQSDIYKKQLI